MKLLCLNTNKGEKISEVIDFINEENTNFVALQEVYGSQVKTYKEITGYEFIFFSPSLNTVEHGEYGNLFMSRIKPLSASTKFIDGKFINNFIYPPEGVSFDNEPRTMQILNFNVDDKILKIINLHGAYQLNGYKGDSERMSIMCQKIIDEYEINIPIIICGDFNLKPNTQCIAKMSKILNRASNQTEDDKTIDYLFISNDLTVKEFKRNKVYISDHYPILCEFSI